MLKYTLLIALLVLFGYSHRQYRQCRRMKTECVRPSRIYIASSNSTYSRNYTISVNVRSLVTKYGQNTVKVGSFSKNSCNICKKGSDFRG